MLIRRSQNTSSAMWTPISIDEIYDQISTAERELNGDLWNFWQLIRIDPQKWQEKTMGAEGDGFWAVAICGRRVIWYNDIEEGFNMSQYTLYGHIDGYWCNQYDLKEAVQQLYDLIKFGGDLLGQAGGPYNL